MNNRETPSPDICDPEGESKKRQRQRQTDQRHGRPAMRLLMRRSRWHRVYACLRHLPSAETTKAPVSRGLCVFATDAYFSEVEMFWKFVFSVLPMPLTAVMITIEMPAAIRPYSMAVAPDSSFTKRETRFFIESSMCTRGWSN